MVAMDESSAGWPGARGYPPVRGLLPFAVVARFKDASDEDLPRRGGSGPGDALVGRLRGSRSAMAGIRWRWWVAVATTTAAAAAIRGFGTDRGQIGRNFKSWPLPFFYYETLLIDVVWE